jgi:proteasome lid subunit RPN8/RPN11
MLHRMILGGHVLTDLREALHSATHREACGYLLGSYEGNDAVVTRVLPVTNSAGWWGAFAISAHEQKRAERFGKMNSLKAVAIYHSHPRGDGRLSDADCRCLRRSELPWVIIYSSPLGGHADPAIVAYAPPLGRGIPLEFVNKCFTA